MPQLMPELQNQVIQPNMPSQPSQAWQQVRIYRMHLSLWRIPTLPWTFLMQENASLSYVAPQALYLVQFDPVDIPAGPRPPFDDWSPVRRTLSEVPMAMTYNNTNVD